MYHFETLPRVHVFAPCVLQIQWLGITLRLYQKFTDSCHVSLRSIGIGSLRVFGFRKSQFSNWNPTTIFPKLSICWQVSPCQSMAHNSSTLWALGVSTLRPSPSFGSFDLSTHVLMDPTVQIFSDPSAFHVSGISSFKLSSSQTHGIWRFRSTLVIRRLKFTPNNLTTQICSCDRTTKILLWVSSSLGFRNFESQTLIGSLSRACKC